MATNNNSSPQQSQQYPRAFALLTSLFFMWGFITVTNDVLINTFEKIFDLSSFQSGLVQFAFFSAYFVVSLIYFIISSNKGNDPINKIGYKNGMVFSLIVCGLGCLLFYPAAAAKSYLLFLTALFVLASGVTLLQICANPYAAIMGSKESASSRLNFAQGFNSLGTTIGPLIGVVLIFQIFSNGEANVDAVGKTYLIYGIIFLLAAALVKVSKMPTFSNTEQIPKGLEVLKYSHLKWGIVAIFFYVGGEVAIGSYLVKFFQHPDVMGLSQEAANYFLAYYWGGAMIGRLLGAVSLNGNISNNKKYSLMGLISIGIFGFIYLVTSIKNTNGEFYFQFLDFAKVSLFIAFLVLNYLAFLLGRSQPARTLSIFAGIVIILLIMSILGQGQFAFWSIISIGLFNSIMWSNIFTLAIKDLGKYTSQGSSLLVMAVVGGAFIPPLQGLLVDSIGIRLSYLVPIICYAYLVFYGLIGYKQDTTQS
ncbi:MAG: sugar MFS transporter [Aureispira sp.]|nr:sugar MFS transporter [Aureispira sp.]